jgi:hypothetical protein
MDNIITVTEVGKHFDKNSREMNDIFRELAWINKDKRGWKVTQLGEQYGAIQNNFKGRLSVKWCETIKDNKILIGILKATIQEETQKQKDFREKFPATHRTSDGHMVRSKAEMLIDDWLYREHIVHAYEKRLPVEEDLYCDFFLPQGKVYIEFWGLENNKKYEQRKEVKKNIYEKYNLNLIELTDKEISNLDDIFPRLLINYGINII